MNNPYKLTIERQSLRMLIIKEKTLYDTLVLFFFLFFFYRQKSNRYIKEPKRGYTKYIGSIHVHTKEKTRKPSS